MRLEKTHLAGRAHLAEITALLRGIRLSDRFAGLYEAADAQWWWRQDDASDPRRQQFWRTGRTTVAALLLYDEGGTWTCDFVHLPSLPAPMMETLRSDILRTLSEIPEPATLTVREDDAALRTALVRHGWRQTGLSTVQTVLEAAPKAAAVLPEGFQFETRAAASGRPHPMTRQNRNPADVEERFAACSLYRPDLDYAVVHLSGAAVAYALFWADPITHVGLIEPLRTEEAYQRRGIGSALVQEGVRRLRQAKAETIKVSYREDNPAARGLYHKCGFRDRFHKLEYRKRAGAG
ncbi:MAG: GNAT family N-acetyltransferase [Candidatus Eisenbacteria bacterium]|nr:GNAT family N-acetyltransferase [Candidatus Eisenbacteria bacterium]